MPSRSQKLLPALEDLNNLLALHVLGFIRLVSFVSIAASDVRARLSPKAAAWAQPERAHGLSGGQAEPKPSERARLGSALAWATLLGENLPKLLIIQCKLAGTTRIPRKKLFSMIESIAISREELTYVPHSTGVTMSQRQSGATINEGQQSVR